MNIKKIETDSGIYDIKDEVARDGLASTNLTIQELQAFINEYIESHAKDEDHQKTIENIKNINSMQSYGSVCYSPYNNPDTWQFGSGGVSEDDSGNISIFLGVTNNKDGYLLKYVNGVFNLKSALLPNFGHCNDIEIVDGTVYTNVLYTVNLSNPSVPINSTLLNLYDEITLSQFGTFNLQPLINYLNGLAIFSTAITQIGTHCYNKDKDVWAFMSATTALKVISEVPSKTAVIGGRNVRVPDFSDMSKVKSYIYEQLPELNPYREIYGQVIKYYKEGIYSHFAYKPNKILFFDFNKNNNLDYVEPFHTFNFGDFGGSSIYSGEPEGLGFIGDKFYTFSYYRALSNSHAFYIETHVGDIEKGISNINNEVATTLVYNQTIYVTAPLNVLEAPEMRLCTGFGDGANDFMGLCQAVNALKSEPFNDDTINIVLRGSGTFRPESIRTNRRVIISQDSVATCKYSYLRIDHSANISINGISLSANSYYFINGSAPTTQGILYIWNSQNIKISNCSISPATYYFGIYFNNSSGRTFSNAIANSFTEYGIRVLGGAESLFCVSESTTLDARSSSQITALQCSGAITAGNGSNITILKNGTFTQN